MPSHPLVPQLVPQLQLLRPHHQPFVQFRPQRQIKANSKLSNHTRMSESSQSYSLWLKLPMGCLATQLEQEICTQAQQHDGPQFEPHVTLLGGIYCSKEHALDTTARLAGKLKKFRVNFLDVSCGSTFHRCVYLLVGKEDAIMQAGQLARQEFDKECDFFPHLSLLYADLNPEALHTAHQAAVKRLYGDSSNYSTLLTETGFTVQAITVWHTPEDDKTLQSWQQVGEFALAD